MRGIWTAVVTVAVLGWPLSIAGQQAQTPANATARCRDGTYSTSRTARGTCSWHGGVAEWLASARCEDGTLSTSRVRQGACAGHGGVVAWLASGGPAAAGASSFVGGAIAGSETASVDSMPWVGSSRGRTYYRRGCRGASGLTPANRIYFRSEEEAQKAGYRRSAQADC
jgi:hypothetical protein